MAPRMVQAPGRGEPGDRQAVLRSLLDAAVKVVGDLAADPLLGRMVTVFARMPPADRETILGILEREVDARLLTEATRQTMSGIGLVPNPSARIYTRVIERDQEAPLNRDETVFASVRAMRMFSRSVGPAAEVWEANMLAALRELDVEELDTIGRFVELLLAQVESVRRQRGGDSRA